jgi:hypothetical protein
MSERWGEGGEEEGKDEDTYNSSKHSQPTMNFPID